MISNETSKDKNVKLKYQTLAWKPGERRMLTKLIKLL